MTRSVRRFPDLERLSRALADEVAAVAEAAALARGRASIALSGGGTPDRMFQLLAERGPTALPWQRIDLWWCDERAVPPSHQDSNYGRARQVLVEPLGLDPARVHRIRGELPEPEDAARAYQAELVGALGTPPVLDLVLLGLGADGHTASLFPDSPALAETARFAVATRAPAGLPVAARISLTVPVLVAARRVLFQVAGADKAAAVAAALEGPRDPARHPAQLVDPAGDLGWWLDEAAAALLRDPEGAR